jgi:hypothetical protein
MEKQLCSDCGNMKDEDGNCHTGNCPNQELDLNGCSILICECGHGEEEHIDYVNECCECECSEFKENEE